MTCPVLTTASPFLTTTLYHLDCQAQTIGQSGYAALATPGSPVSLLLGAALTIFIAIIGYRLLLDDTPTLRDGAVLVAKLGFALLLATSWPAFRTLAYDVAMNAPAELASTIGRSAGLPGATGGLVDQLQAVDDGLTQLQSLGTGRPTGVAGVATQATSGSTQATVQQQIQEQEQVALSRIQDRPRFDPQRDGKLLGEARTIFLGSTVAAYGSVRLIAGLLLALGPLFALCLLFQGTIGIFEGWVRVLVGAALGALVSSVVLGVELAILAPWLNDTLKQRWGNVPVPGGSTELVALTLVFAVVLLAALVAVARLAYGFRFHAIAKTVVQQFGGREKQSSGAGARTAGAAEADERSRALGIAGAIAAAQRRERGIVAAADGAPSRSSSVATAAARDSGTTAVARLGQSARRRTGSRVSAAANRRDRSR